MFVRSLILATLLTGCAIAPDDPLVTRGKELRADIDRTYRTMQEAHAIKHDGTGRNFITDVVTKYIPPRTSFDEAEAILRAAGLTVYPRTPNILPPPEKYEVWATIENYDRWRTLFCPCSTAVNVRLRQESPYDYSVVQSLEASITLSFL